MMASVDEVVELVDDAMQKGAIGRLTSGFYSIRVPSEFIASIGREASAKFVRY